MKLTACLFFIILIFITSCQEEDFIYSYPETDKLLVSITRKSRDLEHRTEFKYDNLNRMIEIQSFDKREQKTLESLVYDKQGRLIEKNTGTDKFSYKYNTKDQLIEQNRHYTPVNGKWEWDQKTEYKYNLN